MSQQMMVPRGDDDERFESAIIRASQDDTIDIAKLQALLDMQRTVARERAVRMFNTAMAQAQSEMEPIIRNAVNVHTKSRYAKLETIDRTMRPIYTRAGFSVRFGSEPSPRQGWMRVTITVAHTGGHYETNYLDAPPDDAGTKGTPNKTPIQSVGSSVTYLRRYLLCMSFNIVLADTDDPDDDGNGERDQQANRSYGSSDRSGTEHPANGGDALAMLDKLNGDAWLRALRRLLETASTLNGVHAVARHRTVTKTLDDPATPTLVRANIRDWLREAHERMAPSVGDEQGQTKQQTKQPSSDDPVEALLAQVEAMDLITLNGLASNAQWRAKLRDLFPPDTDRVDEAVQARIIALRGAGKEPSHEQA